MSVVNCPHCGGELEAAATVYFDITESERDKDEVLVIKDMEFSIVNDKYDDHPAALQHEIRVACSECGIEYHDYYVADRAEERTEFQPGSGS